MTNKTAMTYEDLAKAGRMAEAGAVVEGLDAIVGMTISKRLSNLEGMDDYSTLTFTWHLKSGGTIIQSESILARSFEQLFVDFTDMTEDQTSQFVGYIRPLTEEDDDDDAADNMDGTTLDDD